MKKMILALCFGLISQVAYAATHAFEGKVEGADVATPYITVLAQETECQYPRYCNYKGHLIRLQSSDSQINQDILAAMNEGASVRVEGDKLDYVGQSDGWQIRDLEVKVIIRN